MEGEEKSAKLHMMTQFDVEQDETDDYYVYDDSEIEQHTRDHLNK